MRRNVILVAVLGAGLAGCGKFRELFSAHADVAAEAGGQELSSRRLADIMTGAGKGVRLNRETAELIATTWVDYTLLATAVAAELHRQPRPATRRGQLREALRYVRGRPDILTVLVMVFFVSTFAFTCESHSGWSRWPWRPMRVTKVS